MKDMSLYAKFSLLPEQMKTEVADFIDFLIAKSRSQEKKDKPRPTFGSGKGMFVLRADFDEPLEDFKDYMH